jgi:hypothetical protein
MSTAETKIAGVERLEKRGLVVGLIALALLVVFGLRNPTEFFHSYLFAFVFWNGVPLGCFAILMLHNLVGGTWGFPLRRPLECGAKTFYLMAVLVLPLLFGIRVLYSWADPAKVQADPLLQYKHLYLNEPFFVVRAVIYFFLWILITYLLNKWSHQQDETGDAAITTRIQYLSAPGILVFGLTVTFMSIDWVMSLEPHWTSTIFGMIFMVGSALVAMSVMTISIILLTPEKSLQGLVTPLLLNDYGNLLLTFTMLWAYLSFSQFLIIWGGNLREEIPFYTSRAKGDWAGVGLLLIVFHFAVPFLLLLNRIVKRRAKVLIWVAAGLVVMYMVDIFWVITPAFHPAGPEIHPTDLLAIVGIGGLWLWCYAGQLKGRQLLPLNDPRLKELMEHAAHHA